MAFGTGSKICPTLIQGRSHPSPIIYSLQGLSYETGPVSRRRRWKCWRQWNGRRRWNVWRRRWDRQRRWDRRRRWRRPPLWIHMWRHLVNKFWDTSSFLYKGVREIWSGHVPYPQFCQCGPLSKWLNFTYSFNIWIFRTTSVPSIWRHLCNLLQEIQ